MKSNSTILIVSEHLLLPYWLFQCQLPLITSLAKIILKRINLELLATYLELWLERLKVGHKIFPSDTGLCRNRSG